MTTTNYPNGRLAAFIPHWLAWPMSAISTLAAFAGAGLVFASAALGSLDAVRWGGGAFLVAAVTWHVADLAQANHPI